ARDRSGRSPQQRRMMLQLAGSEPQRRQRRKMTATPSNGQDDAREKVRQAARSREIEKGKTKMRESRFNARMSACDRSFMRVCQCSPSIAKPETPEVWQH